MCMFLSQICCVIALFTASCCLLTQCPVSSLSCDPYQSWLCASFIFHCLIVTSTTDIAWLRWLGVVWDPQPVMTQTHIPFSFLFLLLLLHDVNCLNASIFLFDSSSLTPFSFDSLLLACYMTHTVMSTTDIAWLRCWRGLWDPWHVWVVGDLVEWGWPSCHDKGIGRQIPKGILDWR